MMRRVSLCPYGAMESDFWGSQGFTLGYFPTLPPGVDAVDLPE
jgi:hypothetical protein